MVIKSLAYHFEVMWASSQSSFASGYHPNSESVISARGAFILLISWWIVGRRTLAALDILTLVIYLCGIVTIAAIANSDTAPKATSAPKAIKSSLVLKLLKEDQPISKFVIWWIPALVNMADIIDSVELELVKGLTAEPFLNYNIEFWLTQFHRITGQKEGQTT